MEINGKEYPFWGQFVKSQNKWVGGVLEDFGDSFDKRMGVTPTETTITGIELTKNGEDSAFFTVKGENFDCGFGVEYGGVVVGEDGYITFNGYGGHTWRIKKPK